MLPPLTVGSRDLSLRTNIHRLLTLTRRPFKTVVWLFLNCCFVYCLAFFCCFLMNASLLIRIKTWIFRKRKCVCCLKWKIRLVPLLLVFLAAVLLSLLHTSMHIAFFFSQLMNIWPAAVSARQQARDYWPQSRPEPRGASQLQGFQPALPWCHGGFRLLQYLADKRRPEVSTCWRPSPRGWFRF